MGLERSGHIEAKRELSVGYQIGLKASLIPNLSIGIICREIAGIRGVSQVPVSSAIGAMSRCILQAHHYDALVLTIGNLPDGLGLVVFHIRNVRPCKGSRGPGSGAMAMSEIVFK
jgi:hypothetical protein